MQKYAVEVEIRIRGRVYTEDKSAADAMRYVESRDAYELLQRLGDKMSEEVFVSDVYEEVNPKER